MIYKTTYSESLRLSSLLSKTRVLVFLLCFVASTQAQTSPSDDFDRDGIINSQDLDDDNDGILDTDENKSSTLILSGFEVLYSADGSGRLSKGSRTIVRNAISSSGVSYHLILEITDIGGLTADAYVGIQTNGSVTMFDGIPNQNPYFTYSLKFVPVEGFSDGLYQNNTPIAGALIPNITIVAADVDGTGTYQEVCGYKPVPEITKAVIIGANLSPGGFTTGGPGSAFTYYKSDSHSDNNQGTDSGHWMTIYYDSFSEANLIWGVRGTASSKRGAGSLTTIIGNPDSADIDKDGFDNQYDLDSDGDGYSDSNEAYSNNTLAGPDQQYGVTNGTVAAIDPFTGNVAAANYSIVNYTPVIIPFKVNIPADQVVVIGNSTNATFTVTINGASFTVIYKWQVNKNPAVTKYAATNKNAAETWTDITNGGIYSGADTNTLTLTGITPDMEGYEYRLVVDDTNGKTITSAKTKLSLSSLGVNKNEISGLSIYPNPVKDVLHITSNSNSEKAVIIFDVLGKQVLNTKTSDNAVNVSSLKGGSYFVKITEDGKKDTKKIIIE